MDQNEVRQIRIRLDRAEQRVFNAACSLGFSTVPVGLLGGMLGGLGASTGAGAFLGGCLGLTFANMLYQLKRYVERRADRNRLLDQLDEALAGNAEEFSRRNPMAEIREEPDGYITIFNPDGSPLVGIREGSAAAQIRTEHEMRSGAGREEAPAQEEEELAGPAAAAGRAPPRATIRRLIEDARRANLPQINPAYIAAARGGYPRVGAVDDERKEEEDGAAAPLGFFEQQRRRNPFYMGIRGLPREE